MNKQMITLTIRMQGIGAWPVGPEAPAITIGRALSNDIVLDDAGLSRQHAAVTYRNGAVWIEDLQSKNGTFVNGRAVRHQTQLRPGDSLRLGSQALEVEGEQGTILDSHHEMRPRPAMEQSSSANLRLADIPAEGDPSFAWLLGFMGEVAQGLLGDSSPEAYAQQVLDRLFDYMRPSQGALLLRNEEGELEPVVQRQGENQGGPQPISKSLVNLAVTQRKAMVFHQPDQGEEAPPPSSVMEFGIHSAVFAPLIHQEQVVGLLYLDARGGRAPFGQQHLDLVVTLSHLVAAKLHTLRLRQEVQSVRNMALAAQQRVLQNQLNPHALFNALNGIMELIHQDRALAEAQVRHLSSFLRRILTASEADLGTLAEERELLHDYLAMESLRLGKRLRLTWDWKASVDDVRIPPLLLQPLVENALKHGIGPCCEGGELRLCAHLEGGTAVLRVINGGVPYFPGQAQGSGIGLKNLASRLALHFGNRASLSLGTMGGETLAEVRVPTKA